MDDEPTTVVEDARVDEDIDHAAHADSPAVAAPAMPETGEPAVDRVIASLAALDSLPVGEHAAVYEAAHDTLRQALAGRADTSEGA